MLDQDPIAAPTPHATRPAPRPADPAAFARDVAALRADLTAAIGPEDLAHLKKLERWGRLCSALGYATAWIAPNPLSALLIAHGNTVRWTIVMHHVGHGAYDRVPGVRRHPLQVRALTRPRPSPPRTRSPRERRAPAPSPRTRCAPASAPGSRSRRSR